MNVYCAAPIRGNKENEEYARLIPSAVLAAGQNPLCELTLNSSGIPEDSEIFSRDINWLNESSCVIAEVSGASTGVGFEIAYALYNLKIPVLALYNEENSRSVSAMIKGCTSELLTIRSYSNRDDLSGIIDHFILDLTS